MHNKECGCSGGGCKGRRYLTKVEKREHLLHKQECLEKELQGIKEALQEIET